MGRKLVMVPPNWQHPNNADGHPQPMYDQWFEDAFDEWLAEFDRIRTGDLTDIERECYPSSRPLAEWLLDEGAPHDLAYYRPWRDEEATWFQVWQTVSEGSPVTPPFATKGELVDYLVEHGDFWQQKRWEEGNRFMQPEKPGYSSKAAEAFVEAGYAPSMMISQAADGARTMAMGIDIPAMLKDSPR